MTQGELCHKVVASECFWTLGKHTVVVLVSQISLTGIHALSLRGRRGALAAAEDGGSAFTKHGLMTRQASTNACELAHCRRSRGRACLSATMPPTLCPTRLTASAYCWSGSRQSIRDSTSRVQAWTAMYLTQVLSSARHDSLQRLWTQ